MYSRNYEIPRNLVCPGIISHNSSYYLKMLHVTEITEFPCQSHYNEVW